jgi:hypothetical protein
VFPEEASAAYQAVVAYKSFLVVALFETEAADTFAVDSAVEHSMAFVDIAEVAGSLAVVHNIAERTDDRMID